MPLHHENPAQSAEHQASSKLKWLVVFYVLLIIYGSLLPFRGWQTPHPWINPVLTPWPAYDPGSDILTNVLAYLPLGFLISHFWMRTSRVTGLLLPVTAGFALSFCMELLQEALPSRVSSVQDIFNNTLGTLIGSLMALGLSSDSLTGRRLHAWRERRFVPGTLPNLVLVVLLLWAATELFPYVPSTNLRIIKAGMSPFINTLRHPELFNASKALMDGCSIFGIGVLTRTVMREPVLPPLIAFVLGVTFLKSIIVYQTLSLEFFCAALVSLAILSQLTWQNRHGLAGLGMIAIALAKLIDELHPGSLYGYLSFNWIPFAAQVGRLSGLDDILSTLWLALGLAVFARIITGDRLRLWMSLLGGGAVFSVWFLLEWNQKYLQGRVPDITDPLLGMFIWWVGWAVE